MHLHLRNPSPRLWSKAQSPVLLKEETQRRDLKLRSGMLSLSGRGISLLITARFAETTSWTFVSRASLSLVPVCSNSVVQVLSVKRIKVRPQQKNALSRGEFAMYERESPTLFPTILTLVLACLSFPLYLTLAEDKTSLPSRQQRLGISEIRSLRRFNGKDIP
ncbi:hypothetical protein HRR80_003024 [Exophiala dermatitidis]|uniref:Uncharacterized protein n=1 Tax=Exophiala dermatitidis TaxID=5970 RepID=A0AAN6IWT5_EXODE|nr:hypothetical protein HRR79_003567 [Exophiala dermatitidis]KAJ4685381.1 hypothetical protein HRR95_001889 [Exophiala dermatitidis]KAJ4697297.1 hypothetical protein HRR87_001816 [Exophiala dermatitidis]KAJ8992983.1 hypothetical protein HRR80_003024 [Exophiala dermatitidis]